MFEKAWMVTHKIVFSLDVFLDLADISLGCLFKFPRVQRKYVGQTAKTAKNRQNNKNTT